jgi:hypothetical protein
MRETSCASHSPMRTSVDSICRSTDGRTRPLDDLSRRRSSRAAYGAQPRLTASTGAGCTAQHCWWCTTWLLPEDFAASSTCIGWGKDMSSSDNVARYTSPARHRSKVDSCRLAYLACRCHSMLFVAIRAARVEYLSPPPPHLGYGCHYRSHGVRMSSRVMSICVGCNVIGGRIVKFRKRSKCQR